MQSDYTTIELAYVTPIFIQNKNSEAINELIETYESYNPELLKKIHFVFIDDCSPIEISIKTTKLNYTLARITDDIQWNQGGARNLGVSLAKASKLVLTDLDHIFPEALLQYFIKTKLPKYFYRIRREQNGIPIHSGANIFFCTKSLFYKSLGVDEEFCGHYGYEDVYFAKLQEALGSKFRKIRKYRISLHEHKQVNKDTNTVSQHFLKRDTLRNSKLLEKKSQFLKTRNPLQGHSRLNINFKWEIVKENYI